MGLGNKVKKLEEAIPKCDSRITRVAKPGEVLTDAGPTLTLPVGR